MNKNKHLNHSGQNDINVFETREFEKATDIHSYGIFKSLCFEDVYSNSAFKPTSRSIKFNEQAPLVHM